MRFHRLLPLAVLAACTNTSSPDTDTDPVDTVDSDDPDLTPVVTVSPAAPVTTDDLVASVSSVRAGATVTWRWTSSGGSSSVTADRVSESLTVKGDAWCAIATVLVEGEEAKTAQGCVTVVNTPPTATVELTPEVPNTTINLEAIPTSVDPDGDPVTFEYRWTVAEEDGPTIPAGTTTGIVLGSSLEKGQTWTVEVTPNDGEVDGAVATDSVVVGNAPPVVTTAELGPALTRTLGTLEATVNGTDPDGDGGLTRRFTWTRRRGGVETVLLSNVTQDRLGGGNFDKHDEIWFDVRMSDGEATSPDVRSNMVVIANTEPLIDSVVVTPASGGELITLTCDGEGWLDDDGDAEGYTYRWEVNGTTVQGATAATLGGASFAKGDGVVCYATPYDGEASGAPLASNQVSILNTPPSITGVTLSKTSPLVADTITATPVGGSDPDGDPHIAYAYQWYVQNVAVPPPLGTASSLSGAFGPGQRVFCEVTPSDGEDVGTPVRSSLAIVVNNKPVATPVTLSPLPVYGSRDVTASSSATDADGDAVTMRWRWRVNGIVVPSATTSTLSHTLFVRGDTVEAIVTPNDGYEDGSARSSGPVNVVNIPPTITSVTVTPALAYETSTLTCAASGFSDGDGDSPVYNYRWLKGGVEILGQVSSTLTGASFSRGDNIVCAVTPGDGFGTGTAVQSSQLTIANSKPTLASVTVTPSAPKAGDTVTASTAGGADADGDTVTSVIEWLVNGTVVGSGLTLDPTRYRPGDSIVARATPFDGRENGTPVTSAAVVAVNSPPVVLSLGIAPASPVTTDNLVATPSAQDPDGDTVTYAYTWFVNGVAVPGVTGALLGPAASSRGQSVEVEVLAADGRGGTATRRAGPVVIRNGRPTVTSVAVTPAPAYESSVLSCTPTGAQDPDGDTISWTFVWIVGGAEVARTETLDGSKFSRGSQVTCIATPTDGELSGDPRTSPSLVISNSPPVLASAELSAEAPIASTELSVVLGALTDPDGDATDVLVDWYVNGVKVATGDTFVNGFSRDDEVYAVVTPTDFVTVGTPLTTDPVVVLNAPPEVLSVVLGPTNVSVSDTITADIETEDADGDTVTSTFVWYVDDVEVQRGASAELAPGPFGMGSEVYVEVIPNDGFVDGSTFVSATIEVGNSAPTITSVVISPLPVRETSTITCVPSGWFDADGDPEGYQFRWRVNGDVKSGNPSINGFLFKRGDSITCEATPYDGSSFGVPLVSAPAVVQNSPPTIVSYSLSNAAPRELDVVSVYQAGVSDPDGNDVVTVTVHWFVNGSEVYVGPTLNGTWFDKGDEIYAQLALSDSIDTVTVTTNVGVAVNTPPRVDSLSLSPGTPFVTDDIVSVITTFDPDPADTVAITYRWTIDGVTELGQTGSSLAAGVARKREEVVLFATPSDGEVSGLTYSSAPVTVRNSVPVVVETLLNPDPITAATGAECSGVGVSDADGDPITLSYSWEVDGVATQEGPSLSAPYVARGRTLRCFTRTSDGEGDGVAVPSRLATVVNAPPSLGALLISPSSPNVTSVLAAQLIAPYDADGDLLTWSYAWFVNDVEKGTLALFDSTDGAFERGDVVHVRVILDDGFEQADPVFSEPVVVENAVPRSVGLPQILPESPNTVSTLTASATVVDDDGDPVTSRWEWYVDGVVVQNGPANTLSGSMFARDQEVWVSLYLDDGLQESDPVDSVSVFIQNSPPTRPVAVLAPTSPRPGQDNVTCTATSTTDLDNDPLTYQFSWTVGGIAFGGSTVGNVSTLSASLISPREIITCSVTASDGTSNSIASQVVQIAASIDAQKTCKDWYNQAYLTSGYYILDPDGRNGPLPEYEAYCNHDFDQAGWTRVIRTEGYNLNFGQDTSAIVSSYVNARATSGVYETFTKIDRWQAIAIVAITGAQAGQFASFELAGNDPPFYSVMQYLQACRAEAIHPNDDAYWPAVRTLGHSSRHSSFQRAGGLTVKRAATGSTSAVNEFTMCGVNLSSDNDVSYLVFHDQPLDGNDYGDSFRGQAQVGAIWSFANGDYHSAASVHIGQGAMQNYAGWKGAIGSSAQTWHEGTYEIYIR